MFGASFAPTQVFHSDVLNLLSMGDMWRSRAPPTPLEFDAIRAGTFVLARNAQNGAAVPQTNGTTGSSATEKQLNGGSMSSSAEANGAKLKDQRTLTLQDNLELFVVRCVPRLELGNEGRLIRFS